MARALQISTSITSGLELAL